MLSGINLFVVSLSVSLTVSLSILVILRKPLRSVLVELCRSDSHAEFWLQLGSIWVTLVPAVSVMFHPVVAGAVDDMPAAMLELVVRVRTSIIGLLLALAVIGLVLFVYISRHERK